MVARPGEHENTMPVRQPQLRFGPCATDDAHGVMSEPVLVHVPQSVEHVEHDSLD